MNISAKKKKIHQIKNKKQKFLKRNFLNLLAERLIAVEDAPGAIDAASSSPATSAPAAAVVGAVAPALVTATSGAAAAGRTEISVGEGGDWSSLGEQQKWFSIGLSSTSSPWVDPTGWIHVANIHHDPFDTLKCPQLGENAGV